MDGGGRTWGTFLGLARIGKRTRTYCKARQWISDEPRSQSAGGPDGGSCRWRRVVPTERVLEQRERK